MHFDVFLYVIRSIGRHAVSAENACRYRATCNACRTIERPAFSAGYAACRSIERHTLSAGFAGRIFS